MNIMMVAALGAVVGSEAPASRPTPPDPRTAAAVLSVDQAWGKAERSGDAEYVDRLLLPRYRSVGVKGDVTPKAAIVAHARRAHQDADAAVKAQAWRDQHPLRGEVVIVGDTAALTWISTKTPDAQPVSSCDIFVYRAGRWRALYSQHTDASL